MKIKYLLFPAAAIVVFACLDHFISGSKKETIDDVQPILAHTERDEYSAKVREIEADFEQRRRKIENYYAGVFGQLQAQRYEDLRSTNAANKASRARSVRQTQSPEFDTYHYAGSNSRGTAGDASSAGRSQQSTTTRVEINPSSDFWSKTSQPSAASERDRAGETVQTAGDVDGEYDSDYEHYQRQKACALSDLEKERQFALTAVYNQHNYETAGAISSKASGTVTGILSSDGAPLAVIDGNVIKEGQIINGVKVVKIRPDRVEFRYAKKQWTQKVNESPPSNWP